MNIEELKEEKINLEKNIKQLINDFNDNTNSSVYSVNIDISASIQIGDTKQKYKVHHVRVLIDL